MHTRVGQSPRHFDRHELQAARFVQKLICEQNELSDVQMIKDLATLALQEERHVW